MNPAKTLNAFAKAKRSAFRLLKIRNRSEFEITSRLKKNNFSASVIHRTINYLKECRLIDDRQFTRDWIKSRLAKPFGFKRISFELRQKGIGEELIETEINRIKANVDEENICIALAKKKDARYKFLEETKRKRRIFGYLSRRGFSLNAIRKATRKI